MCLKVWVGGLLHCTHLAGLHDDSSLGPQPNSDLGPNSYRQLLNIYSSMKDGLTTTLTCGAACAGSFARAAYPGGALPLAGVASPMHVQKKATQCFSFVFPLGKDYHAIVLFLLRGRHARGRSTPTEENDLPKLLEVRAGS